MSVESVADKLAQDIRSEESLHGPMVKDLAKLAASTAVTEEDFHATFLKALGRYDLYVMKIDGQSTLILIGLVLKRAFRMPSSTC